MIASFSRLLPARPALVIGECCFVFCGSFFPLVFRGDSYLPSVAVAVSMRDVLLFFFHPPVGRSPALFSFLLPTCLLLCPEVLGYATWMQITSSVYLALSRLHHKVSPSLVLFYFCWLFFLILFRDFFYIDPPPPPYAPDSEAEFRFDPSWQYLLVSGFQPPHEPVLTLVVFPFRPYVLEFEHITAAVFSATSPHATSVFFLLFPYSPAP